MVLLAISAGWIILPDTLSLLLDRPISEIIVEVYDTSEWPSLLRVATIIFAPVLEEVFFCGFPFEGFRQSRLSFIGAIGLTALVWSLFHVQYAVYEIATIFVFGIVLGIVRLKTGSLWSPMLMHVFST